MACSLNSRSPVSTMSDTTKPNRVAPPRPPPPTISPQRTLNQTPSSVSLGESPVSPPRYEDSHPVPIRRGSEGEVEMRRRNKPSRRQSTRRSMRRRQRPEITIISSQPMNQHPAFADGAKGSHIPPEAPPSYDEAIKSTPTNTSAIELEMPVPESAPSPPSRVLPVDFVIFDQEDHSELNSRNQSSETEPKVFFCSTSVETRFSERVPYRSTSRNSNQNNSEGLNAHAETANSVVAYFSPTGSSPNNSSTQSVYVREGERTPVPTPRIRRKVSTTRCTVQEFLTNTRENQGTTLGSTTPAVRPRPKVPPKRPELIARFSGAHSDAADTSNPEHYTHVDLQLGSSLSRSEEVLTQPSHVDMSSHSPSSTNDVLSLFEDDLPGNTPSLPTPLQTRRLPPPPAPPS
uniref:Uncharacterized protein n=2 Tax=Ciona intestinalis TaxID=7719 RepID=H2XNR3_CIOIN